MTQAPAGQPIPLPADFQVQFAPGEELLPWQRDRMHFPRPMSPMMHALVPTEGINDAFRHYGLPLRALNRRFNTYHYRASAPTVSSPEERGAAAQAATKKLHEDARRIGKLWYDELLPRVLEHIAWFEKLNLEAASDAELEGYVDEMLRRHRDLWGIHFRTVMPTHTSVEIFQDFYEETFEPADEFEALSLIEGFDNLTLQANRQLWLLARDATPAVREVIAREEPGRILEALEQTPGGQEFLARFQTFLQQYGQRGGDQFIEIADPFLIEDPTPLLKNLQDHARHPERDWDADRAKIAEQREAMIAAARERLTNYPAAVRDEFETLLSAAQDGVVIAEDHGFYIDSMSTFKVRQLLLACGRRLAARGCLQRPEDVFMLSVEDLRAALKDPQADCTALVASRHAEIAHYANVTPPEAIGVPGPPAPAGRNGFFGTAPEPSPDPQVLKGAAGSPGKITARARLLRGLSHGSNLQPGEVLVAETTSPIWTPLFASAAAVVTETGGILSHCAVVAREYRIPAVVGVPGAMASIRDGQMLEVDGNAGTVRLLEQ